MRIDGAPRWLLVGSGDIARKRVAPAIQSVTPRGIAAVCDVNSQRAESFAQDYNIKEVYSDLSTALAQSGAEAVYIATPVSLHSPQACAVLEAGRHVLVEKPLGITAADASAAAEAVARSRLTAGCAYFRRCSARYRSLKAMIDRGEFGTIALVRMMYCSWFDPSVDDPKYWRVQRSLGGGGALVDMGAHMIDVLIGLLGLPLRVFARTANLLHQYEVEDSVVVQMLLSSTASVHASFHWNSRTWNHEFEIVGSQARVRWSPYDSGPVLKVVGSHIEQLDLPPAENVHEPLVRDFVNSIQNGREPVAPLGEALKTNLVLDAIYRSAASGVEVAL